MIEGKYTLEQLPITEEFLKEKRVIQDRGELALVTDGTIIRHITYFSLNPGIGFYRGGHYHKKKAETVYLISGVLKVLLINIETKLSKELVIQSGNRLTIKPFCAHKFIAIRQSQVIEYYNTPYEAEDDYAYTKFID